MGTIPDPNILWSTPMDPYNGRVQQRTRALAASDGQFEIDIFNCANRIYLAAYNISRLSTKVDDNLTLDDSLVAWILFLGFFGS